MDPAELLPRLNEVLPAARGWIERLVAENRPLARPVQALGFQRLTGYFPESALGDWRRTPCGWRRKTKRPGASSRRFSVAMPVSARPGFVT
jgi:hypothetical protein